MQTVVKAHPQTNRITFNLILTQTHLPEENSHVQTCTSQKPVRHEPGMTERLREYFTLKLHYHNKICLDKNTDVFSACKGDASAAGPLPAPPHALTSSLSGTSRGAYLTPLGCVPYVWRKKVLSVPGINESRHWGPIVVMLHLTYLLRHVTADQT